MLRWSTNFLILVRAIAVFAISSKTLVHEDKDTCSSFAVCNDLETARRCESMEWCENQAAACDAVNMLEKGSKLIFGSAVDTVNSLCDNNFMAFKQPRDAHKVVNIKLEVQEGQSPFSLRFNFDGHNVSLSEHTGAKIAIRMNDEIIHDNLHNNTVAKNDGKKFDDHMCQSYFVCNNFETARQCQSLAWCETQGAACKAVDLLRKGTRLFDAAADDVDLLCDSQFIAFRRTLNKYLKINFEIEDKQSSFSVRFDFGSNFTLGEHAEEKGANRINDEIVNDNPYSVVLSNN